MNQRVADDLGGLKQAAKVFGAVAPEIERLDRRIDDVKTELDEHVEECRVSERPGRRYDYPSEVPYQEEFIPDPIIRQIIERLKRARDDSSNESFESVCADFGYPDLLVERELARYLGANKLYNLMLRG
jgi:hypothetical protein